MTESEVDQLQSQISTLESSNADLRKLLLEIRRAMDNQTLYVSLTRDPDKRLAGERILDKMRAIEREEAQKEREKKAREENGDSDVRTDMKTTARNIQRAVSSMSIDSKTAHENIQTVREEISSKTTNQNIERMTEAGLSEESARVLSYISSHPYNGRSAICEGVRLEESKWIGIRNELVNTGLIEQIGERKGAKYRVVVREPENITEKGESE